MRRGEERRVEERRVEERRGSDWVRLKGVF